MNTELETLTADSADRRLAMNELDKNVIVVAGAGTGKTTILIQRFLGLLLDKEIPIERIVALTFTKKAAEEMRDRLQKELRQHEGPLAQRALDNMTRAQIGTIHSFASDLLHLYPLQAGVDPKFQVDEGIIAEGIFNDLWQAWLGRELSATGKKSAPWQELLSEVSLQDIHDLARAIASPEVDLETLNNRQDLRPLARGWKEELDALLNVNSISSKSHATGPRVEALRRVFFEAAHGRKLQPADLEAIDKLEPPDRWSPEATATLKRLIRRGLALYHVNDALFEKVLGMIVPFVSSYRKELRRRGVVPFSGLLVQARDLLRDHRDVRAQLKKRFDVFLIDEFQDTDPLQGEILLYLAEDLGMEAADWKGTRPGRGRLFIVGDPKQSIYHFRGADMAAYEEFCDHLTGHGAARSTLVTNFRSHSQILDPINQMFPSLMIEEPFVQPRYIDLVPFAEKTDRPGLEFFVIDKGESEEKVLAPQIRRQEAHVIADWIEKNVGKDWKYQDVALLFRTSSPFEDYIDVFRERNIPYLAEGEKSFYRRPEVMQLLNVLSAIANPDDVLSLVGVLRSPIGALTDREILELKMADGLTYKRKPRILQEKVGPIFDQLKRWAQQSATVPLYELIQDVFEKTWLPVLAAQGRHGDQEWANLTKIQRLAYSWSSSEQLTINDFVDRFREYREDERDEGENPLADVQVDAVKIMTLHKAKGLEFPVVFIPNVGASSMDRKDKVLLRRDWRHGRTGLRLPSADVVSSTLIVIEDEIDRREEAEEVRVFYVGMTRAKERLILMLNAQARSGSVFTDFLKRSGAWPAEKIQIPTSVYPVKKQELSLRRSAEGFIGMDGAAAAKAALRFEAWQTEKEKLSQEPLFTSPSAYLKEIEKWRVVDDDGEASVRRDKAIELGLACHKVLEEWDFKTTKKNIKKQLKKASAMPEARELLESFMETPAYEKLAASKIIGREIPFFYAAGGVYMRGIIDLLYEREGKLVVADYKTSRSSDGAHYGQQGAAYREAVERVLQRPAIFELIFLRTGEQRVLS